MAKLQEFAKNVLHSDLGGISVMDMREFEREAYRRGFRLVAGIDEVGRGPLAGPVVAAAVILPRNIDLPGVTDSKKLTPAQREELCGGILSAAVDVGIGCIEPCVIDRINILQASFQAMIQAVSNLNSKPDYLIIDGPYKLTLDIAQQGVVDGDALCLSVAAASIVAKVHRDRLMCEYHEQYPLYGFDRHKGYATADHCRALRELGPCPIHRRSFRGVKDPCKDVCDDAIETSKGTEG